MIEVKARILQRAVFIVGECLECEIILTNHGERSKNVTKNTTEKKINANIQVSNKYIYEHVSWSRTKDAENNDGYVTLAWASAQIYCNCNINERILKYPTNFQNHISQEHISKFTSFSPVMGEKGHCLCSTSANVLFCNLKLKKGESRRFLYSQKLPNDFPPSYKGQNIKLSYKVCIGIGRIGQPLCMIRLPFRLFEVRGIFKSLKEKSIQKAADADLLPLSLNESRSVVLKNPFLKENIDEKFSTLDAAMEALTGFTVKRNMNTYNIQSVNGAVGKFCLSKYYYRLGEDVLGTFDFSDAPISCIKYTVSLQIEETISKNCLLQPSLSNLVHYITTSCYEECCCLATRTNFLLPIPVTSTSEFTHKIVSIRWRLHFEFIIGSKDEEKKEDGEKDGSIKIPSNFKTESMLWDLPIHIVATNPIQASLMMQAESSESLFLPYNTPN